MVFALEAWIQPMLDTCWSPDTSRALRMLQAGELAEAPLKQPLQKKGLRRHKRTASPSTLNSLAAALQEVAQPRTWDQLPKEVLVRVLRSVHPDSARATTAAMRLTCKSWRSVVTADVRELEPRHAVPDVGPAQRPAGAPAPRFSFHTNPGPHASVGLFPGLASFRNVRKINFRLMDGALVLNDASLQGLGLLKNLRVLDLSWELCEVTDATLLAVAGLTELRELDLRGAKLITDTGLSLLGGLRRLERLSLNGAGQLTGAFLPALMPALANTLRDLDLGRCTNLAPHNLAEIGRLRHLERLSLWRCAGATDAVLAALAPAAASLSELNLSECPALSDAGAAALFPRLPRSLTKLNVGHCPCLTPAALSSLGARMSAPAPAPCASRPDPEPQPSSARSCRSELSTSTCARVAACPFAAAAAAASAEVSSARPVCEGVVSARDEVLLHAQRATPLRISYSRCQEALAPYACLYAPPGSHAIMSRVNACTHCHQLRRMQGSRAD